MVIPTDATGATIQTVSADGIIRNDDGAFNHAPSAILASGSGPGALMRVIETAPNGTVVGSLSTVDPDGSPDTATPTTFELVDSVGALLTATQTPFRIVGNELVVDIDEMLGTAGYPLNYNTASAISIHIRATNGEFAITQEFVVGVQPLTGFDGAGNAFRVSNDTTDQYDWATATYVTSPDGRLIDIQQVNDDGTSQRTLFYDPAEPYSQQTSYRDAAGRLTDVQTTYPDGHGDRTLYDAADQYGWTRYDQYLRSATPGGPLEVYDEIGTWDADYAANPGGHWRNIYDVGDLASDYDRLALVYDDAWVLKSQVIYRDNGTIDTFVY